MIIAINKNSKEIEKINSALVKIAETMRTTNEANRTILGRYVKALKGAKKLFETDQMNDLNKGKLKEGLEKTLKAVYDDMSMMR